MKKILIYLFALSLIIPLPVMAETSFPSFPMSFYGTVKLDGVGLPAGSTVQAYAGGELKGEVVLDEAGVYGYSEPTKKRLLVGEYDGEEIIFKYIVSGGSSPESGAVPAEYTEIFEAGKTEQLNINFKTQVASQSSPSSGGGGSGGGGGTLKKAETIEEAKEEEQESLEDNQEDEEQNEEDTSNKISELAQNKELTPREIQIKQILSDAGSVFEGKVNSILDNSKEQRNEQLESSSEEKYTKKLVSGISAISDETKRSITNFVAYGTVSTKILGAGERAGVVNSYKSAFGKLPSTQFEWEDVIKIANGRWPSERSEDKENKAKGEFKFIYKREPNMEHPNDNAAVTVMAYGLRPSDRNLDSERVAIKIFKNIYKYSPESAIDWDIARAIAYSGAVR